MADKKEQGKDGEAEALSVGAVIAAQQKEIERLTKALKDANDKLAKAHQHQVGGPRVAK